MVDVIFVRNLFAQKIFWSKNFLGQKTFWSTNVFPQKKKWGQKCFFFYYKNLGSENIMCQKILVKKKIRQKKFEKKLLGQKIFGEKKLCEKKWVKKIVWKKNCVNIFFVSNISWIKRLRLLIFLVKTNSGRVNQRMRIDEPPKKMVGLKKNFLGCF